MNDKLKLIGTFLGIVIVVWGAYAYLNRFALCADLKETQQIVQMQYKALQQENDFRFQGIKLDQTNRDLIQFSNECRKNPKNEIACNEARRLESVKKVEEKKLEQLGERK